MSKASDLLTLMEDRDLSSVGDPDSKYTVVRRGSGPKRGADYKHSLKQYLIDYTNDIKKWAEDRGFKVTGEKKGEPEFKELLGPFFDKNTGKVRYENEYAYRGYSK